MTARSMVDRISTKRLEVAERAKDPGHVFLSVAYLIEEAALTRAFHRIRKDAAVGVDGITKEQYGRNLEENIRGLHQRMKEMRWRHQPIRRVLIPKEGGRSRPIGISTLEDKVVQGALCELLELLYEPLFKDFSYGFRRGRSAHDALRALNEVVSRGEASFILELDVQSYFDSIPREMLKGMLRERVLDGSLLRLIGKCLHVGVLEGEEYSEPEGGTPQGSVLSPVLGNIYLHHVLDVWFEEEVKPRLRGRAHLIRYADDGVITFEHEDDARRVREVITKRFEKYGLTLHPEKTRVVQYRRPRKDSGEGKGPGTFDFLGFTHYWRRSRRGKWVPGVKTRKARVQRLLTAVADWCRSHRHWKVKDQHAALSRRLNGHFNYFGANGNASSLYRVVRGCEEVWRKWLNRRSQRARMGWKRFQLLLRTYPLPRPGVRFQLWGTAP